MHATLVKIQRKLTDLINQLQSAIPNDEPFGPAHGNWSFPGLTKSELVEEAQAIIDMIGSADVDELGAQEARIADYIRRIDHLRTQTVGQMWGNSAQAAPAYMLTLDGLRKAVAPLYPTQTDDERGEAAAKLRKLVTQVRSMEARIKELEPRTGSLATMVARIENAYNAADQLPTDLAALAEARGTIEQLAKDATKEQGDIASLRQKATTLTGELGQSATDAKSVLERCETAYSAATSVGLAAAFTERSSALSKSMWAWVFGLVVALGAGSYFGSTQLHALTDLFKQPNVGASVVLLNLMLSFLSIGAPVWFGWLATKQIGQRFRLAEDYAFKASISRAYEGFRREAARFDKDMEARLLASALTRLDELPLRLVETDSHGSPWHELASSDLVKQALKAVPGFAEQVKDLAARAVSSVAPSKSKASEGPDDTPKG